MRKVFMKLRFFFLAFASAVAIPDRMAKAIDDGSEMLAAQGSPLPIAWSTPYEALPAEPEWDLDEINQSLPSQNPTSTPTPSLEQTYSNYSVAIPTIEIATASVSHLSGEVLNDPNVAPLAAEANGLLFEAVYPEQPTFIASPVITVEEASPEADFYGSPEPNPTFVVGDIDPLQPEPLTLNEIRNFRDGININAWTVFNPVAVERLREFLGSPSYRVRENTMTLFREALIADTVNQIHALSWDNQPVNARIAFYTFLRSQLLLEIVQKNSSPECHRRTEILLAELLSSLQEALVLIDYPAVFRRYVDERVRQRLAARGAVYQSLAQRLDSAIHHYFSPTAIEEISDVRCEVLDAESKARFLDFYRTLIFHSGEFFCGAGNREEIYDLDGLGCHYATSCTPSDSLLSSFNLSPEDVAAVRSELSRAVITVASRRIRVVGSVGGERMTSIELADLSVTLEGMLLYSVGIGILNPGDLFGRLLTVNLPASLDLFGMEVGGPATTYSPIYFAGPDLLQGLEHMFRVALGLSTLRELT